MSRIAIIAGSGALPAALAAAVADPVVAAMDGFLPDGLTPDLVFRLERLAPLLAELAACDVERVIFAGAVRRPSLDPALFDPRTAAMVPRILAAMQSGDDGLLRAVVAVFEEAGFTVIGVSDIAPHLVPPEGVLAGAVTEQDRRDTERAVQIVGALGGVDVGQGTVVAEGQCLAVETLPGTDAMLDWVAATRQGTGGVFFKAPKPEQDRRIDLPTLGVATIRRAAAAGLSCVAWEANGVILLDREALVAEAAEKGITLWARAS
ncbi:LpxI family protein [Falsirhodobacter sp. 20TX0035]|uniref:LpxI family protein n=1 Tax=Falsirhodobacter sp. 20TX0035 TaxID=3022019 RepID=UPI00232C861B|nr:UDP-2,3-diacylglucosamine diphosphatase LpxI [Falsirhodobacter sp. 20TX0035]MDB6453403.1 UDP-2,3-diacylglucosamine diphosphatase LpxI [Falsirhodobacter sp. 20TX0035]